MTSPGPAAAESARQLAACFHVLRQLVHGSSRWLALEPRLDVKYALADQLHDDARSARALSRRLHELRPPLDVNHPGPELSTLLDRVATTGSADDYLALVFGELKPRLAATVERQLAQIDPWQDEPSLRALVELRHRQAYHLADAPLPGGPTRGAAEPLPADVLPGHPRRLRPGPQPHAPAREAYVAVVNASAGVPAGAALLTELAGAAGGVGGSRPASALVHALMHERLCWAETAALTSHEHPELFGAFHLDMSKLAGDAARHAQALERLLGERYESHWGAHPVSLGDFRRLHQPELAPRLVAMRDAADARVRWRSRLWSGERAAPPGEAETRETLDFLLADDQDHFECLSDWSERLGARDT